MRTLIIVAMLIAATTICAQAEERADRYRFYTLKSNNGDLVLLLDTATGKNWQVSVDATGKVTQLSANTVEGIAYAPKDEEQLYSKVKSANIEDLSTSNTATKAELDRLYGYGLDSEKLMVIRDKVKAAGLSKK